VKRACNKETEGGRGEGSLVYHMQRSQKKNRKLLNGNKEVGE
jgi:hypothetical protein